MGEVLKHKSELARGRGAGEGRQQSRKGVIAEFRGGHCKGRQGQILNGLVCNPYEFGFHPRVSGKSLKHFVSRGRF